MISYQHLYFALRDKSSRIKSVGSSWPPVSHGRCRTQHGLTATLSRLQRLSTVFQLRCAGRACAVDATEDFSARFDAVTDNAAAAVRANRRQRVDCALEAVEGVTLSTHDHFKRLVVVVLANFACRHTQFVRARGGCWRCLFRS